MKEENYEVLLEMLTELEQEHIRIKKKIDDIEIKIQETDSYIKCLQEEQDERDFKFFSPRAAFKSNVNKAELEKIIEDKSNYEEEYRLLQIEYDEYSSKISRLNNIIQDEREYILSIFNVQEEERYRISRDLHDTSLQNITSLIHKVELSSMFIDQDPLRAKLELSLVNKNLRAIVDEIRSTIFNLRPMSVDDLGLKATFERLINVINDHKGYDVDLLIEDVSCENNMSLIILYRTVQECLLNIDKHAEASKIIFHSTWEGDKYHILIQDNGKGFDFEEVKDKNSKHFGIALMKERIDVLGGNMTIDSASGCGTRIEIDIPLGDDFNIKK